MDRNFDSLSARQIEQAGWLKYSPMSPAKTQKTNWGYQNLKEAENQKVKILLRQEQKNWRADAIEVVNFRRRVDQCRSERGLIFRPASKI